MELLIKLNVKEYCHSCSKFEPEKIGGEQLYAEGRPYSVTEVQVVCKNKEICEFVFEYFKNGGIEN